MKLSSIKVGQKYQEVRNNIIKGSNENLVIGNLPVFMLTDYVSARDLETKEEVFILRDYKTGIITDVQTDVNKIYDSSKSEKILNEIVDKNYH